MSEHTAAPWRWEINPTTHSVKLISGASMRPYVMGFERYGMQSGQPTLRVDGRMTKVSEICEPAEGREHHADWHQVLDHPDANLIAAAPELYAAAKKALDVLETFGGKRHALGKNAIADLRQAIAKAEGGPTDE